MLSISEWKQAWYLINTPAGYDPDGAGGLKRDGGINGIGVSHGNRYNSAIDTLRTFTTNTGWNPGANGGGSNGDWGIHVFAGDRNPDTSFRYFNFSGSVTVGSTTSAIGTDAGGLFAVNNDNWQYTIKDADGNVIQGPIGEQGAVSGSTFGVSSQETLQLNAFDQNAHPTQANYLATGLAQYNGGSPSSYDGANVLTSGSGHQGLNGLRDWLQYGDADLDGTVTAADYTIWRDHLGQAGGWAQGDFNGNGVVDTADYALWHDRNFVIPATGSAAAVSEPTAWLIASLGGALVAAPFRRRFRRLRSEWAAQRPPLVFSSHCLGTAWFWQSSRSKPRINLACRECQHFIRS